MPRYFGWDIGGVHLKLSCLTIDPAGYARIATSIEPFEIWRSPKSLARRLTGLLAREGTAHAAGKTRPGREGEARHAVTMTAEISDVFADRSAGVRSIVRACSDAFGSRPFRVFTLDGDWVGPEEAMERPLRAAAANWAATAHLIARYAGRSILIDVGSTTTDIIPIGDAGPIAGGNDDMARLLSGELVYTGALRTPPASLAESVPLRGGACRIASERFCLMADVYLLLGRIDEPDYTVATADDRGKGRQESAARLARLVCADRGDLLDEELIAIAAHLEDRQIDLVARALRQVIDRSPGARSWPIWTAGVGSFLAGRAAARVGAASRSLAQLLPALVSDRWERAAPSAALAILLAAGNGDTLRRSR